MSVTNLTDEVSCWVQSIGTNKMNSASTSQGRFHRELSDGCFVAEVLKRYFPKLVDMHSYPKASSVKTKKDNWQHLRRTVFSKVGIKLSDEHLSMIAEAKPGGIESILKQLYSVAMKVEAEKRQIEQARTEDEQHEALPPPEWNSVTCQIRKLKDGTEELMYKDKFFCYKDIADEQQKSLENEVQELKTKITQLKNQAARHQITLGLKEEKLAELTHDMQILRQKLGDTPY